MRAPTFGGATYDEARDGERLNTQLERVREVMATGRWYTLDELASLCGGSTPSISARLRDLRKPRLNPPSGWVIERERVIGGLFRYRKGAEVPAGAQLELL